MRKATDCRSEARETRRVVLQNAGVPGGRAHRAVNRTVGWCSFQMLATTGLAAATGAAHASDPVQRVCAEAARLRGGASGAAVTVEEAATAHDISRTHLMKVANLLVRQDFLKGVRGRAGGLMLARAPAEISLGVLIRATEPAFAIVECFGEAEGRSALRGDRWRDILSDAMEAFLRELDRYSLTDLLADPARFGLAGKPA